MKAKKRNTNQTEPAMCMELHCMLYWQTLCCHGVERCYNKIQQQIQTNKRSATQINHIVLHPGVQVHMSTKLIQALAGFCCRVGMEPPLRAFLNHLQAPRCTQPEDATLLAAIPWCHHNGHSLVQHCLHWHCIADITSDTMYVKQNWGHVPITFSSA